ncbi:MAG: PEP-CTERM sorting domain-containing protein [Planctomycetota bacterium]|nr:PEP-CTERM sorting domain-containing protein [Planctomycetota bacterium]
MVCRLIFTLALLASTSSVASASQLAFDYIGNSSSSYVASWVSVTIGSQMEYGKYGISYQPNNAQTIDHLSVAMLGGMTSTAIQPSEADWANLHDLWQLQIWSVPANAPPVDTVTHGIVPAIVNEYWQGQPVPSPPGSSNYLVNPVGGIPSRAGLSPSGKQIWLADFDLNAFNIVLDPSRIYMLEVSVFTNTGAPYIYIFQNSTPGQVGVRVTKNFLQPFPGGFELANTPTYAMTVNPVPEPASCLLLAIGSGAVGLARWRRQQQTCRVSHERIDASSSQRGR